MARGKFRGFRALADIWFHLGLEPAHAARHLPRCIERVRNGPIIVPEKASAAAVPTIATLDHGSPMWRFAVLVASGKVTREDLRILAEVVEALADGLHLR